MARRPLLLIIFCMWTELVIRCYYTKGNHEQDAVSTISMDHLRKKFNSEERMLALLFQVICGFQ
jgi:hypothetical protein